MTEVKNNLALGRNSARSSGNHSEGRRPKEQRRGLRIAIPEQKPRKSPVASGMPRAASHYQRLVSDLKHRYKISVRRWRTQMAGVAYELTYQD
ncbi:MAG TPA: hypothetical protein VGN88_02985, partial [Phycisphaerae bacterium]